jgi:5-(carboxyamino)imidazole ribonucleotide mutase
MSADDALVGIVMGSDSDWPVMRAAAEALEEFGVAYEADVVSAHRMPRDMIEYGSSAERRGLRVIIAGAGGAAHLPGMLASVTPLPVIGVPVPLADLGGLDSLLSIVQMPAGIPVATVAVGGARNAGLLAVRILAAGEGPGAGALRARLVAFAEHLADQARAKGAALRDLSQPELSGVDSVRSGHAPSQPLARDRLWRAWEVGVSIGATLAAARRHAGLTVADVSQRTRVREPIIQGIEHDDYASCGGDFYARGHIRAIAEAVGADPAPLIEEFDDRWQSSPELTAAEVFQPSMPLRKRERHRMRWLGLLAVLVLAILGFAIYKFASGAGHAHPTAAVSSPGTAAGGTPAPASASAAGVRASTAQASPTAASPAPPAPPRTLAPASVAAFGPDGTADGDNPQQAAGAAGGSPASAWSSDWYATADFGNLQAGTGLLLDMGRAVTITSVRLTLGPAPGTDLQLRAGDTPVLAGLRPAASLSGVGGTVQLRLGTPVNAHYLLIWFTKLPPDPSGTYQVSVYNIRVQGRP